MAFFRVAITSLFFVGVASLVTQQAPKRRSQNPQDLEDLRMRKHSSDGAGADFSKLISDAHTTMGAVSRVVDAAKVVFKVANGTGFQLLDTLSGQLDGLRVSFAEMNSTANQALVIPFITTTDVAELVAKFFAQVGASLEVAQAELTAGRKTIANMVGERSRAFEAAAGQTLERYESALSDIQTAMGKIWPLSVIFGREAHKSIRKANETLDALFARVDAINGTIVQVLITGVVDLATTVTHDFEAQCLSITKDLPITFITQAAGLCTQSTDFLSAFGTAVQQFTATVPEAVSAIRSTLAPMRPLASKLLDAMHHAKSFTQSP